MVKRNVFLCIIAMIVSPGIVLAEGVNPLGIETLMGSGYGNFSGNICFGDVSRSFDCRFLGG